ncbi:MAG: metallophosphoesterase [Treponema sp.]|nr:metallophosphoesterase [Treponema sp.]
MAGLLAAAGILALIMGVYIFIIIFRIMKFFNLPVRQKSIKIITAALTFTILCLSFNLKTHVLIYVMHFLAFTLAVDIIHLPVKHFCRNRKPSLLRILHGIRILCIIPAVLLIIVSTIAWFNMHRIIRTEYTVTSPKLLRDYKVLLISDMHWATIQDTKVFIKTIDKINRENADLIILDGDITDENTSKKEMLNVFKILGSLKAKYGIYYVYGNHDRQLYTSSPAFSLEELDEAITENGIRILQDYAVLIDKDLVLAGREDFSMDHMEKRSSINEILEGFSRNSFIIVADHQPKDVSAVKKAGADLLLSGHTHAGQIFPAGRIMDAAGSFTYGKYTDGNFSVIVTSGIAGWGYSFRTERNCEYAVVNLIKQD